MNHKEKTTNEIRQEIPATPVRFIFAMARPHARFAVGAFLAVTIAQLLSSFSPYILKRLVDAALLQADKATQVAHISHWSMLYVAILGTAFLFWRLSGFIGMELHSRAQKTAYERLYAYVTLHSHTYFSNRFAGSVTHKIAHAADGVERMIEGMLWQYSNGVLQLVVSIALFASVSFIFGWLYFGLIATIIILNIFLVRRRRPFVVSSAQASSRFRGAGVDIITNISSVRQFSRRSYELAYVSDSAEDMRSKDIRQLRMSELGMALNNALIVGVLGLIVGLVIVRFQAGLVSVGDIVLIITMVFQTNGTLVFIGSTINGIVRVYGEMQEGLQDVLLPHEITDREGAVSLVVKKGEIAFNDVSFSYENQSVFEHLALVVKPGERVGVVGGSGAGKTTLVSLLLRQHELNDGAIRIDGENIAEVTQDSLREAIAVVPQEPQLFHRSIRDNIGYGAVGATDEEVAHAAELAYATDFIDVLPQKYETLVGERGVKLSGGQRQRIAIARAILKNAPILVLDEATSALDSASEVVIQKALHTLMEKKTVIAIAHRLSTLREMDRIVVLDKGIVAESGTHEALLAEKGIYAELWGHQSGGFLQD